MAGPQLPLRTQLVDSHGAIKRALNLDCYRPLVIRGLCQLLDFSYIASEAVCESLGDLNSCDNAPFSLPLS